MADPVGERTVAWWEDPVAGSGRVVYRGPLAGPVEMTVGFDGWEGEARTVALEEVEPGVHASDELELGDHLALDAAFRSGDDWDNNGDLDYRLWVGFAPVDSHMHVSGASAGDLGLPTLRRAMASTGVVEGVVSWVDNAVLDRLPLEEAGLHPLVWIRPGETPVDDVERRLAAGAVGLKLHPTIDDYPADDPALDPYVEAAAAAGRLVASHSAPGTADPDHIRALAERHPGVPVIMYHTYLGPDEGRYRAAAHVLELPSLYLETSWCRSEVVLELIAQVGPERVLFGSDASVDGAHHYCRHPPNVDGVETYHRTLDVLARELDDEALRLVTGDNARRLFGLRSATPAPNHL